jgi:PST family polysaccharide transporter
MKAAALIVGAAGVGVVGLLQNFLAVGSTLAGLGLGGAATRQLAAERGQVGAAGEAPVRHAVLWAGALLSLAAFGITWLLRVPLASFFLGDAARTAEIVWLGAGIALATVASLQIGVLAGQRRIGDVARVNIGSAIVATLVGVGALLIGGSAGVLAFVLSVPFAGAAAGWWIIRRNAEVAAPRPSLPAIARQWSLLLKLGTAIMLGGLITTGGQLAVRSLIGDQLGRAALGQFHAGWTISMTYLGLVLQAMATDYYPRLSERIHVPHAARRLVVEQTEVALLLAAPVLLTMMAAAPLIIQLLYAAEFREAADMLRWQILGDLLKLVAWPLGFVLLAAGQSRAYVVLEATAMAVFVGATAALLRVFGLTGTGIAFLAMYALYLPAVAWRSHRLIGRTLAARQFGGLALLATALAVVFAVSSISPAAALLLGGVLALASLVIAIDRLRAALPPPIAAWIATLRRALPARWKRA